MGSPTKRRWGYFKGHMMKSRFFPKKDELVLSTITALIVVALVQQGATALMYGRQHSMFQKHAVSQMKK